MEKCNTLKVVSSEMDLPEVVMIREALIFFTKICPSRESSLKIVIGRRYWDRNCQQRHSSSCGFLNHAKVGKGAKN
jgi:hypothetical protein